MPISWRIENDLVLLETTDPWTVLEWTACADAFLADPNFHSGMAVVSDRRHSRAPLGDEIRGLVGLIRARSVAIGKARWGIVTTDPANYGMARMAQILLEGTSVTLRVFYDLEEAQAWARA